MLNKNGETSSLFLISHCLETVKEEHGLNSKAQAGHKGTNNPRLSANCTLVVEWGDFFFLMTGDLNGAHGQNRKV